ncbi:MAG: CehA/McbA family metallohydrolase, partial [Phycisphaeraceae bacterium]|nr:CehA/McbA family metallohydrolase [Phycisphaeraceae bacterium]
MIVAVLLAVATAPASADPTAETGVLAYRILGPDDTPLPARLTVLEPDVDLVALGGPFGDRHAVREDVCYALDGIGELVLPAGGCELLASRGIEWSIDRRRVEIPADGRLEVELRIRPAVDTTGLIGGDFHLHTLTHSGHGDSNMPERIVSLVGEGVDFAVATDHNRNIDYIPTITTLGASSQITSVVGNELSTPIGHFNIFPVDPTRPPVPARLAAAPPMFRLIRLEPNALDVVPVIQVNHPRWAGIDYFSQVELDETTGTSSNPRWSADFDAIEVLNENALWGWRDPADADGVDVGSQTHSSMLDWYALLDTGHRSIATGNSDSHSVKANFAGVPRNYMGSSTDDPGEIDPREMIDAIRRGDVVVTSGPIVRASIPDRGLHEDPRMATVDANGRVRIAVEIQAAPWIDVDRIRVIRDGDEIDRIPVENTRDRIRFEGDIEVPVATDGWIVLLVEGDDSLAPVVDGKKRPVIPVAIVNPFRVDADLDGDWTPPLDRVKREVATMTADLASSAWENASGAERRRIIAAARSTDGLDADVRDGLIESGLDDDSDQWRVVRLGAVRAATGAPAFAEPLERIMTDDAADDRLAAAALRALAAISPDRAAVRLQQFIDRRGVTPLRDLGDAGLNEVAGPGPRAWMVSGPYP